jgi:LEA14-like dessication related protein
MGRFLHFAACALAMSLLGACVGMPGVGDPLQVTVADVESLPSEGLEMRMLVRLRVQNPNDAPVEYDGVYLSLAVLDQTIATGVSDERGTIPRYGESLVSVPVTASTLRVALHTLGLIGSGKPIDKVTYRLEGKLGGPLFAAARFQSQGELALPQGTP